MGPVNAMEPWLRMVEIQAFEIDATIVTHGVVITGTMIPSVLFDRWTQKVSQHADKRAELGHLTLKETVRELPRLNQDDTATLRAELKNREGEPLDSTYICLRNAEVRAGPPDNWVRMPYLILRPTSVDAFFPGAPTVSEGGKARP